jgi:hypothetical protein
MSPVAAVEMSSLDWKCSDCSMLGSPFMAGTAISQASDYYAEFV